VVAAAVAATAAMAAMAADQMHEETPAREAAIEHDGRRQDPGHHESSHDEADDACRHEPARAPTFGRLR
jgi:hypothetical protein